MKVHKHEVCLYNWDGDECSHRCSKCLGYITLCVVGVLVTSNIPKREKKRN